MKKIPTLFKRDFKSRLVYDEIYPGNEWVLNGEGFGTVKFDGTPCLIKDNVMHKRYDAKNGKIPPSDFIPCESEPDPITGHWPGWILVKENNEDKFFWEAIEPFQEILPYFFIENGTYELVGPKIQGNPYLLQKHSLWLHGSKRGIPNLKSFEEVKNFLSSFQEEGIVWYHPDGKMAKIKRRDFGFQWPLKF